MSLPLTYLRDTLFTSPVSAAKNAAAKSAAANSLAGIATSLNTLGQNGSKQISSASKPSTKNYGTKSTPQQRAAQNAALNELRENVLVGNIPNSGSGIIPTTQQKINDFAGSSIKATNTVAKGDAEKLDYSGVTYTKGEEKKDTGTKSANAAKKNDTPKETKGDTSVAEPTVPEDDVSGDLIGGLGFDLGGGGGGGFSYPDFGVSDAYTQAMNYTNSLLSQMSTGRTSYSDQIDALIKEYQNREKFSYDMNTDPLFQQMLASSMNSGKMAMQDTIGQAAALTGGYGNTYGQAVGNAAYNQYITEAYENLPDYYNLALDAYNMEGEQMLNELDMLRDADNTEYGRLVNAYNANYNYANDMYDREYTEYLNDRNFKYDNYWNEKNFNYGAYMDALNQSNIDREFEYGVQQDTLDRAERAEERDYQREQDKLKWDYTYANATSDLLNSLGMTGYDSLTNSEIEALQKVYSSNGGGEKGADAVEARLAALGKNVDMDVVANLLTTSYDLLTPYYEAIDSMDISEAEKQRLKSQIKLDSMR